MDTLLTPILIAGISGGVAVLLLALLLPRKSCPKCEAPLPRFRKPSSMREALLGGWCCPTCGERVARDGSPGPKDIR